jgi:hypothetical protein
MGSSLAIRKWGQKRIPYLLGVPGAVTLGGTEIVSDIVLQLYEAGEKRQLAMEFLTITTKEVEVK